MKNIQNKLIVFLFLLLAIPHPGSAQENLTTALRFEVNKIYPPISITKDKLSAANSLIDLNPFYQSSWVSEYISVEILTSDKGGIRKAVGENDILSQEQKESMNTAELGTDILVKVYYIPDNTLIHNDVKEITFSFTVAPENDAKYAGGQEQLKQYLKEKAIDKIPEASFKGYDLAAVKFTIDEQGQIINVHLFQPSKDEKIDELLLETIRKMPSWKPAEYADGTKVKQEFVLTVGNMENCMINLLNIRQEIE